MMLTERQQNHFHTFGFLVVADMFSAPEIKALKATFAQMSDCATSTRSGCRGQSDYLEQINSGMLDDQRLVDTIGSLLGDDAVYLQSWAATYSDDQSWQTTMGWNVEISGGRADAIGEFGGYYFCGARAVIALDKIPAGAFRVIAGSHREPYHDQLWSLSADISSAKRTRRDLEALCDRDQICGSRRDRLFADTNANAFDLEPEKIPHMAVKHEPGDLLVVDDMLWFACLGIESLRTVEIDWKGTPETGHNRKWLEMNLPALRARQSQCVNA